MEIWSGESLEGKLKENKKIFLKHL